MNEKSGVNVMFKGIATLIPDHVYIIYNYKR